MELRTLQALVEVVRQGGFSQAAVALHATQPTISKAIKQLEDDLGVPVLKRIGNRRELSPAGEIVYRHALNMLGLRDELFDSLKELQGMRRGLLRIGYPRAGTNPIFAKLVKQFREAHPNVDVKLLSQTRDGLENMLRTREIDLAVMLLPIREEFDYHVVREETLMAVVPVAHAFATRDALDLPALGGQDVILYDEGFKLNEIITEGFARHGMSAVVTARTNQSDFIVELAAAGVGIGFLPRMFTDRYPHDGVRYVPIVDAAVDWRISLAWLRGAELIPCAQAWLAMVQALPQPA
jgi:DNA-binding transcriptional LysR family regulator